MGSNRAAFRAGNIPKKIPTKREKPKLAAILAPLITVVKFPNTDIAVAAPMPIKIPITPPKTLIIVD